MKRLLAVLMILMGGQALFAADETKGMDIISLSDDNVVKVEAELKAAGMSYTDLVKMLLEAKQKELGAPKESKAAESVVVPVLPADVTSDVVVAGAGSPAVTISAESKTLYDTAGLSEDEIKEIEAVVERELREAGSVKRAISGGRIAEGVREREIKNKVRSKAAMAAAASASKPVAPVYVDVELSNEEVAIGEILNTGVLRYVAPGAERPLNKANHDYSREFKNRRNEAFSTDDGDEKKAIARLYNKEIMPYMYNVVVVDRLYQKLIELKKGGFLSFGYRDAKYADVIGKDFNDKKRELQKFFGVPLSSDEL